MNTWAIAGATLREAIRHRILYLLLVFALLLILSSRTLSFLTVGEGTKIIQDVGLSAINIFGVLIALFVGVGLIFRDMEKRTVQIILSAPVSRAEYILGKYLGLAAALTINTLLMALVLFVLLAWHGAFSSPLMIAVFLLWIELLFITAAAVFFSSFSTPIFSALFTAATYLVGHLLWALPLLQKRLPAGGFNDAIGLIYRLLPDLEYGDVRALAVHGLPIPPERVLFASIHGIGYTALLLLIACWVFRRRDLV